MIHAELQLSRQLCFLVYRLDRQLTAAYRPLLAAIGLTYPQYLVMLVLWEQGTQSVGELCRHLHLDTGTVSPVLKRLAGQGLLVRTRSPSDERTVEIALTPAGQALADQAAGIPRELASCTGLDLAEYQLLHQILSHRLEVMEALSTR